MLFVVVAAMTLMAAMLRAADVPPRAQVGEDVVRSTVDAATRDAVDALMDEIARARLSSRVSVGQLLRDTAGFDDLRKTLQQSEQVGGPRWVDNRTCQVQLQVSGTRVAAALRRIAAANPNLSPLKPESVDALTRDWDRRSFTATGQATATRPVGDQAIGQRPADARRRRDAWERISEADKQSAVAAAKIDAARRCLGSVAPLPLTVRSTVGDALNLREVGDGMEEWLVSQPVERTDFLENLQAEVELKASPAQAFDQFKVLAARQQDVPIPRDEKGWLDVKDLFEQKMRAPIGRAAPQAAEPDLGIGRGGGGGTGADVGPARGMGFAPRKAFGLGGSRGGRDGGSSLIPARPPAWASRQIEAEATASSNRGRLHAARNAEADADKKLRSLVEALPLSKDVTIGQASAKDARIARALDDAMARARIGRAKYHEDGNATVQIYLDLEQVWDALERAR